MMDGAQRRLDVSANNVGNISTPGFRASRVFSRIVDARDARPEDSIVPAAAGATPLKATANPLDLATDPGSVLIFRAGGQHYATRSAQLRRDGEGRLVDGRGGALQAAGGGDLAIGPGTPTILADGTVTVDGQPQARIGLYLDAGSAGPGPDLPEAATGGVVHQGMIAPADVDLAAEMVELTRAGRLAETGARIFQVYDDLLGKAASKLGETGA
jgi:flagellar basal-body rod protein FlgG